MEYQHHNFFNYLFEHTKDLEKNFLLNPGQEISYKDLYNRCLKLAEYLNSEVGEQQNIVILCPNSLFFITVYLATIKSGNVIVPLNYEIEQRNLDYILQLTETKLVFTTTQYKKKLDFKNIRVIDEAGLEEILSGCRLQATGHRSQSANNILYPTPNTEDGSTHTPTPPSHSCSLQPIAHSLSQTPNIEVDATPTPIPTTTPTHPASSIQYPASSIQYPASSIQHPASDSSSSLQPTVCSLTLDSLAEIIFTSGSTGEPKGVMISHKNLMANTWSILEYLKLTSDDIMLVVLPFYYCYGLSLLHTHIRVGGSIALNNMFIMLGSVINDLKKYKCTGFAGVPSHFQILLRKSESFKNTEFPDLKYVTQAGGKLHNAFISEFIETFPAIRFNVMYGQTEATARLSWLPPENLPDKIGSCGIAIPGVFLKIVDEKGLSVKPGEIGELWAAGDNIMMGYFKDPDSNFKSIKDGWLHTGDLAITDENGYIFLTARKKEIIKIGGRRISPKEIEEIVNSLPDVIDCSIEGVYDEILGETMKATIVTISKEKLSIEKVSRYCAERLAAYKIPKIIEIKDRIILSATGKKIK